MSQSYSETLKLIPQLKIGSIVHERGGNRDYAVTEIRDGYFGMTATPETAQNGFLTTGIQDGLLHYDFEIISI